MTQPRSVFSNIKVVFLILFLLIFGAWALYDYRQGNSMVGPLILGGFLVAIAIIFKPWRAGSDEQRPPTTKGGPGMMVLLLLQDTVPPAIPETCDGMASCHPWVVLAVVVAVAAIAIGIWRYNKARP